MPKKNVLREIEVLKTKPRNEFPFALSDWWEAWEYFGGDASDPENWGFVEDGTLERCMVALTNNISLELDQEMRSKGILQRLSADHDDDPERFTEELIRHHDQRREDIRRQCLKTGEYKGGTWTIRSQITREQCAWKAKQGF